MSESSPAAETTGPRTAAAPGVSAPTAESPAAPMAAASVATAPAGTAPTMLPAPVPAGTVAAPAGPPVTGAPRPPSPRRWPGPGREAPIAVVIGATVAGLVAAAALTWDRPGVGWLITGLVATAAIVAAAWGNTAGESRAVRVERAVWAGAALVLLASGAVLAAGWLFVLAVLTAIVAVSIALSGGTSAGGLVLSVLIWPAALVRALPWVARGVASQRGKGGGSALRILAAALVGLLLLIIFGALFAGADAAFARVLDAALPTLNGVTIFRWIWGFGLLGLAVVAASFLAFAPPALDGHPGQHRVRRIEWALPIGALVALFAAFVTVQTTVLFGGHEYVQQTSGLTYAEYARSGFWQLLVVTILVVVVMAVAGRLAPRETPADRLWIQVLLGLLCLFTLVIVASALSRMWAYEQAYGFTQLRLLVSVCELWLGAVVLLIMIAGSNLKDRSRWLPGAVVATAVAALIGIAVLNPDRFIAERNVSRYATSGTIDVSYLGTLSADAVPALMRLPEPLRTCALEGIHQDVWTNLDEWRQWNYGRDHARELLQGYRPPTADQWRQCMAVENEPR
jgi:hypothetical protein